MFRDSEAKFCLRARGSSRLCVRLFELTTPTSCAAENHVELRRIAYDPHVSENIRVGQCDEVERAHLEDEHDHVQIIKA